VLSWRASADGPRRAAIAAGSVSPSTSASSTDGLKPRCSRTFNSQTSRTSTLPILSSYRTLPRTLTKISLTTSRQDQNGDAVTVQSLEWPLKLDFSFVVNSDGSGSQTTTIQQGYNRTEGVPGGTFTTISNTVSPSDTLLFDSSFNITGDQNQSSTQRYFKENSNGNCFSRKIKAANGLLTSVTNGAGCQQ
jgi:hypothetical protein